MGKGAAVVGSRRIGHPDQFKSGRGLHQIDGVLVNAEQGKGGGRRRHKPASGSLANAASYGTTEAPTDVLLRLPEAPWGPMAPGWGEKIPDRPWARKLARNEAWNWNSVGSWSVIHVAEGSGISYS